MASKKKPSGGLSARASSSCAGLLAPGVTARAVFTAQRVSEDWIHRRVLSVRLRADGCTYVRTSLDLEVPEVLLLARGADDRPHRVVIPLTWMKKSADVHRLDLRDGTGHALSLVHSDQQADLALAAMCSWGVEAGLDDFSDDEWARLRREMRALVVEPDEGEAAALASAVAARWGGKRAPAEMLEDVTDFLSLFVANFLVAVVITVDPGHRRQLVKFSFGHGPLVELSPPPELRGFLKWLPKRIARTVIAWRIVGPAWRSYATLDLPDSDLRLAKSTHFELEATGDVVVVRLAVVVGESTIGEVEDRARSIARLEVRPESRATVVPPADDRASEPRLVAHLFPSRSALTSLAGYGSTLTLLLLAYVAGVSIIEDVARRFAADGSIDRLCFASSCLLRTSRLAIADSSAVFPLLAALVGAAAIWAARSTEHSISTYVLRPFRWIVFLTGLNLGVVAVLVTPIEFGSWWGALVLPVAFQLYVLGRFRRARIHVIRKGDTPLIEGLRDVVLDAGTSHRLGAAPPRAPERT